MKYLLGGLFGILLGAAGSLHLTNHYQITTLRERDNSYVVILNRWTGHARAVRPEEIGDYKAP